MPSLWLPSHLKPAHKPVSVVFWFSAKLNHIRVGLPEAYPIPPILSRMGYNKIVCRSARETEIWSQKMRDQERIESEMTDEQREAFEGPIRAQLRAELVTKMLNSRNPVNREFCRWALQRMDEDEEKRRVKKESMMHAEAFEDGK